MAENFRKIIEALAATQAGEFNQSPFSQVVNSRLAGAGNSVAQALMAPGNALRGDYNQVEISPNGSVSPFDPRLVDQASNMAGVISMSSSPVPRPSGSLGMGGSNYVRSLQAEAPLLHREMNAERANQLIENNIQAPWGQERLYWSDVPEMAKGQAENRGVTMTMRTDGVEGRYDTSSKPGLDFVSATGGGKEYVTHSGVDFSKVDELRVSAAINDYGTADDRRFLLRLRDMVQNGQFVVDGSDGFVTTYRRVY